MFYIRHLGNGAFDGVRLALVQVGSQVNPKGYLLLYVVGLTVGVVFQHHKQAQQQQYESDAEYCGGVCAPEVYSAVF